MVDVVISRVTGAGVGFGQGKLIVEVGMLMTEAPPTGGARPPGLHFAEPTDHVRTSVQVRLAEPEL